VLPHHQRALRGGAARLSGLPARRTVFRLHGAVCYRDTLLPPLMATCPRCRGHLTDAHRCPKRPARVAVEIVAVGLIGGLLGLLLVAVFDPRGQITDMDTISVVAGALIAIGINRALRG
jgi:hypothetical protein